MNKTIEKLQAIVENKQASKIDGVLVDLFSASTVMQVYNCVSPENQVKLAALPIQKMVDVSFKTLKRYEQRQK